MISLEQIRNLENKVHKAVSLLTAVQEENQNLKSRLAKYEVRIEELEFTIEEFKEDQSEIEQGIISALQHLDTLEDAVGGLKPSITNPDVSATISTVSPTAVNIEMSTNEQNKVVEQSPETVVTPVEIHAEPVAPAWEAPIQEYQQPAAAQFDFHESDSSNEEPETPSNREPQLDIF